MENMWLMAQSLGIGFHVLSVFSAETIEKEVRNLLRIPHHMRIGFACRLGYSAAHPVTNLRVRRDLKDLTHHNLFGTRGLD
jgi:nitroreductase